LRHARLIPVFGQLIEHFGVESVLYGSATGW
jgi:hypothetical protein